MQSSGYQARACIELVSSKDCTFLPQITKKQKAPFCLIQCPLMKEVL